MISSPRFLATLLVATCSLISANNVAAAVVYEQTFAGVGASGIPTVGWTVAHPAANWYSGGFPYAIQDADTLQPINGQNPLYIGAGSGTGISGENGMFYVTAGNGGFSSIDPTAAPTTFNIYINSQTGGTDDFGSFAVQVGGNWYVAATPMAPPTNTDTLYNLRSLQYDPAAANWNLLTVTPTLVIVGAAAGADLAGPITGVGVVHQINNPANDYSSWNYADYFITIPEPASASLLLASIVTSLLLRTRKL